MTGLVCMPRFILFLGQCALEIYEYIISVEWVSAYIHFVKNVCNVQAEKIALEYYMRSVLMKLYSVGTRQPSCGPRFGRIRTCLAGSRREGPDPAMH